MRIKRIFILFIIFCSYNALFADPAPGFDNYVDFEISMKELDSHVKSGNLDSIKNKYLILNGSFVGFSVVDNNASTFTVEIELINGEWQGITDVFMYRAIIIFSGREYQAMFPEGRRSSSASSEVQTNSGLIVVARLKETRVFEGEVIPVLYGYYLRVFKSG